MTNIDAFPFSLSFGFHSYNHICRMPRSISKHILSRKVFLGGTICRTSGPSLLHLNDVDHCLDVVRFSLNPPFDHHQTRAAMFGQLDDQLCVTPLFGELRVPQNEIKARGRASG